MIEAVDDSDLATLMSQVGQKNKTRFRNHYIKPLIAAGLLDLTIPDKPRSRMQKYKTTNKGKAMLRELSARLLSLDPVQFDHT